MKRTEWKRIACLGASAILLAAFPMSGCSDNGGGNDASGGEEQITISFLHKWGEESRLPYFEYLIEDFTEDHPNVTIEMETAANEAIKDKLRVMAGGTRPDIFFSWSGEFQRKFARAGATLDLTPYFEADPEWTESLMDSIWDSCSYEGKIYGVPFDFNAEVIVYNKDIFQQCGVDVPETWEEFLQVCETIKQNGITPLLLGNSEPWNGLHWLTNLNCRFVSPEVRAVDSDPATCTFDDPGYVEALNAMIELNEKGYFNSGVNSTSYTEQFELFCQGQGAMMSDGTQVLGSRYRDALDESTWDFFFMPEVEGAAGNPNTIAGAPDLFLISSDTEHPDVCVEFLKNMTSMENAQKLAEDIGFTPCVKGAINESNSLPQVLEAFDMIGELDGLAEWIDTDMEARVADKYLAAGQEIFNGASAEELMDGIRETAAAVRAEQEQ